MAHRSVLTSLRVFHVEVIGALIVMGIERLEYL